MSGAQPLEFVPKLAPEELARANFYALLARLFYAPADEALLAALAGGAPLEAEDGGIADAWSRLVAAAGANDAQAVREEYESAFVGIGKAPVSLYTTGYTLRYSSEAPLAGLRRELAGLGLARRENVHEPEDHVAALCEVMRHLIAAQNPLERQKAFFERWLWPAAQPLCDAIGSNDKIVFYRPVASLLLSLCTVEHRAFEML